MARDKGSARARCDAHGAPGEKDAPATAAAAPCGCCASGAATPAHKHTPRSEELKKSVTCRLNRAIGQLNGVKAMIEDDRYCGDVLTQLAAAESAVKAVSRMVMRDHLETCVVERIQQGDTEVVDEVMDLLRKFGA
ncbi:metal-sensing transcriptional repressor [Olsenella umbonata]|uniref:Metal-sensing transcriptional repressor n=1 Tax=Parafannyhessea umbonata TaxID=604330 RepID=A0A7X9T953_9ACTN|nr:metal-sensing transcriptional repressor [Parafannyhessea umbonata]NMF25130.1 metal-sensing transcriptional repressor [Parafannyhessea umbonata]